MNTIEIFYDYECPFCKRGYEDLMDLLPAYPGIKINWYPVEAHPRPEDCHPHTDLCIQAYYIVSELGADMDVFNRILFQATVIEHRDVEKGEVLAEILNGVITSKETFLAFLKDKKHSPKVQENNDLAYEEKEVWYLPAFRLPGKELKKPPRLDAKGGQGVSQKEIKEFLDKVSKL